VFGDAALDLIQEAIADDPLGRDQAGEGGPGRLQAFTQIFASRQPHLMLAGGSRETGDQALGVSPDAPEPALGLHAG
jgi:hypothetical protein